MQLELIKVNPSDYGINNETADSIIKDLPAILLEREPLAEQYKEIIVMDIEDTATAKKAKEVRMLIKNNRTKGIENWHKVNKDFFLKGGQFIDAIKRKEVAENERMESALEQIEKYQEIKEKNRIESLHNKRIEIIDKYVEDTTGLKFGEMADDVWDAYLTAKKKSYDDKIAAEKKAEQERKAQEEKEDAEREAMRIENEKLKEAAEAQKKAAEKADQLRKERNAEMRPYIVFIRDYNAMLNLSPAEYKKELADIKKGAEQQWEFEKKEQERKQAEQDKKEAEQRKANIEALKAKKRADEKAAAAQKELDRIEKELQDRKDREAKQEQEMLAAIEAELTKGDKQKMTDLLKELVNLSESQQFKSKKYQTLHKTVMELVDKINVYVTAKM